MVFQKKKTQLMFSKDTKEFDRISRYILYTIGNFKNWAEFRTLITDNIFLYLIAKKKEELSVIKVLNIPNF